MKKFLLISLITIFSTLNASVLNQQDSSATFSIKKYANTVTVNGEFESFKGEVKVDDDKNLLFFKGEAYVSSIKTDDAKRDSELKSQKYLDEQNYPKIKIQTISIQNNIAHVKVDIKGISKEFEWKITKETINEKQIGRASCRERVLRLV